MAFCVLDCSFNPHSTLKRIAHDNILKRYYVARWSVTAFLFSLFATVAIDPARKRELMMKIRLVVFAALLGAVNSANAAQVTAIYETTFDGGHRAEGTIIYDDAIPIVSGFGLGATNGIEFLDVTFFDPGRVFIRDSCFLLARHSLSFRCSACMPRIII